MSQEIDDNEVPAVSAEELSEIDDILQEAVPEFVNKLKAINSDKLNNQEIGLPTEEEVLKKDRWFYRFWFGLSKTKQMIVVVGAFLTFVALPLLLLSVSGLLTPSFLTTQQTSLESLGDLTIALDRKKNQKDLMQLFLTDQFFLEIPEQLYVIKPFNDIKIGRFGFYMELLHREDETYFKNHYEEVIEILSRTLKQYSVQDFKGIEGKEEMRKVILASLNGRLKTQIKNIRYKLIVF
jgi:hypothetical protein